MKYKIIHDYMMSVRESYESPESEPPRGYSPEDKDMGYRSALRKYGISRTAKSDAIADALIYRKRIDPATLENECNEQMNLFC